MSEIDELIRDSLSTDHFTLVKLERLANERADALRAVLDYLSAAEAFADEIEPYDIRRAIALALGVEE